MTVVKFPGSTARPAVAEQSAKGWQAHELREFHGVCAAAVSAGDAVSWEVGTTELGEPQLYVIGPPPEHDCILMISRVGRLYVLEDGNGRVVFEHDNPMLLAEQACVALRRKRLQIVARVAAAWCAVREFFEEKVEAAMAEPIELLSHAAPQLAALV